MIPDKNLDNVETCRFTSYRRSFKPKKEMFSFVNKRIPHFIRSTSIISAVATHFTLSNTLRAQSTISESKSVIHKVKIQQMLRV